jgi:hypothetical protein
MPLMAASGELSVLVECAGARREIVSSCASSVPCCACDQVQPWREPPVLQVPETVVDTFPVVKTVLARGSVTLSADQSGPRGGIKSVNEDLASPESARSDSSMPLARVSVQPKPSSGPMRNEKPLGGWPCPSGGAMASTAPPATLTLASVLPEPSPSPAAPKSAWKKWLSCSQGAKSREARTVRDAERGRASLSWWRYSLAACATVAWLTCQRQGTAYGRELGSQTCGVDFPQKMERLARPSGIDE